MNDVALNSTSNAKKEKCGGSTGTYLCSCNIPDFLLTPQTLNYSLSFVLTPKTSSRTLTSVSCHNKLYFFVVAVFFRENYSLPIDERSAFVYSSFVAFALVLVFLCAWRLFVAATCPLEVAST